ncbi:hypothetical protein ACFY05_42355 [Microtetraspora fusca]|uniref:Uncharacterized protein n=1 Tax=Microtetraspora fusca TaxID=1997 RepID=A0ABW6VJD2_MICFU
MLRATRWLDERFCTALIHPDYQPQGSAAEERTGIDELTARLREIDEVIDHLRITRKTLSRSPTKTMSSQPHHLPRFPATPHTSRF